MSYTPGPLPEPFDYCYEWDGPWGTRKFSASRHNGSPPARSVAIFTAEQLSAHTAAEVARAVAAERERCAKVCEDLLAYDEYDPGQSFAAAIRSNPQRLQGTGECR